MTNEERIRKLCEAVIEIIDSIPNRKRLESTREEVVAIYEDINNGYECIENEFNPCTVCNYKGCSNCILHELAMKFVGHPSADVAPVCKHKCTKRENGYSFYVKCTCGAEFNVDSYYLEYFKKCPNCGAKMEDE